MELVYLWVEEYKNIKRQGFNFSSRFRCEFKAKYEKDEDGNEVLEDKCELIIEENEDYVSIFPENINITAIVGKNGSGKSSILSNIPNPQYMNNLMKRTNFILVYKVDKNIKIISNVSIKSEYHIDELYNISFDYCSFSQDFLSSELVINVSSYFSQEPTKNNDVLYEIYKNGNHHIDLSKYKKIINQMIFKYSNIDNIFYFNAEEVKVSETFVNIKIILEELKTSLEKEFFSGEHQDTSINVYEYFQSNFDKFSNKEKFLLYVFFKHYKTDKNIIKLIYDLFENIDFTIIDLKDSIFEYENDKLEIDKYIKFYDLIDDESIKNKRLRLKIKDLHPKLEVLFDLNIQDFIDIEFYDKENRKFNNLSHGERHIFSMTLLIYNKLLEQENCNKLILLDEPDNNLHPQWQKKLVKSLIHTFSKIGKSIHIIFTSHSPFILSDIPKENVIFLEKDKETGNCINTTEKMKDFNTFGANIHTLLSHGFFMKDGLMGEFAKSKIERIKRFYEIVKRFEFQIKQNKTPYIYIRIIYKLRIEEFDYIASIIGEPFLQKVIKNYLDELEEIFDKENYKQKKLKKLVEEFGEDTLRKFLDND